MSHEGIEEKHHYHPECKCDACMFENVGAASTGKHPADCQCPRCHNERVRFGTFTKETTKPLPQTVLVSFESGHHKKIEGKWLGDVANSAVPSLWSNWQKPNGKTVHINKDKVEYYEEL